MTGLIVGLIAGCAIGALAYPIACALYDGETAKDWPHVPRLAYAVTGAAISAVVVVGTAALALFLVGLVVI